MYLPEFCMAAVPRKQVFTNVGFRELQSDPNLKQIVSISTVPSVVIEVDQFTTKCCPEVGFRYQNGSEV